MDTSPLATADLPPDTTRNLVRVPAPGGGVLEFWPGLVRRVQTDVAGFLSPTDAPTPIRHTFALTLGHPELLQLGAECAWLDAPEMRVVVEQREAAARAGGRPGMAPPTEDHTAHERAVITAYFDAAESVLQALAAEHAIPYAPPTARLDYRLGLEHADDTSTGLVIAQLVLDEFRRRDVRTPRDGEAWYERLDEQEVPQYTEMECLVRDVVDGAAAEAGITPMRGGSLWWVRAMHVHPRCRGDQLGGRLLAHALRDVVRGAYDLVVCEARPEPTIFAPDPLPPGLADWQAYDHAPVTAVEGIARYFGRMGFRRADDPQHGGPQLRAAAREAFGLPARGESRYEALHEDGAGPPFRAVAMYAFAGDLAFPGMRPLGRPVLTRRGR